MRLELKPVTADVEPSTDRQKWFFERGRRTLGRAPDCDWRLPEDQLSVSKLHCTIERDRDGFLLRDHSANGSRVDGIVVHEGEVARLSDKSRLEMGGVVFSVLIIGEKDQEIGDPDAGLVISDETLTISAILADIAPGGRTATGILGDRDNEDLPHSPPGRTRGATSSRNVEIGWSGPPEIRAATTILPDDWNTDSTSDYASQLEHGSAPHVSVSVAHAKPADDPQTINDAIAPPELDQFEAPVAGRPVEFADRLEPLLVQLQEALEAAFAIFGMDVLSPDSEPAFVRGSRTDALVARVEGLLGRQVELNSALETLVQETGRRLEPRVLEARVDAARRSLPWRRHRSYWQVYRAQFEKDGKALSIREMFHDAMTRVGDGASGALTARYGGSAE
ncbi:MAG TPA: FHA domain-containing protein, partial [Rhizobium sp.]|nr:FHA domain-containing protein [Rhizobium sp.]